MRIIGEKLNLLEQLKVRGGCDLACYCASLWDIIVGPNSQEARDAAIGYWNEHNCPGGIAEP